MAIQRKDKGNNVKTFPREELNGYSYPTGSPAFESAVSSISPTGRYRFHFPGASESRRRTEIDTDPQGSWTGVPSDDPYSVPVQDADDL